jgi:cystathionine beta-synthase
MKTLSPTHSEILTLDQGLQHFENITRRNIQLLPQDILEQLKNRNGTPEELLEAYASITLDQPLMDVSELVRNQIDSAFPGQVMARIAANPGGIKAGPGLTMVQSALEELRKREPNSSIDLVQASSGNTALGMALPTALLRSTTEIGDRIRLHIFGHTRMSNERKILLRTLGLTQFIEDADPNDTLAEGIPNLNYNHTRAKYFQTTVQDTFYDVDQYSQPHNAEGHVQWTAPFVNKKLEQENTRLTHILAGVGTGGAAAGFQKYYSKQPGSPSPQIIGVDSSEKVFFNKSEEANGRSAQEGIGSLVEGLSGDTSLITRENVKRILNGGVIPTVDREVFELALALNKEGLPVGPSGAALFSALGKLQGVTKNSVILLLLPDTNSLYQSKLGNQDWLDEKLPGLKALQKEAFLTFI